MVLVSVEWLAVAVMSFCAVQQTLCFQMQTLSSTPTSSRNNGLQMHRNVYESTNSENSGNRRSFIAKSLATVTLGVASPVPLVHQYAFAEESEPPVANFAPRRAGKRTNEFFTSISIRTLIRF